MKDGDVRVDRCIVKRLKGTFGVEVNIGGVTKAKTLSTLEEARQWRDEQEANRPKREAASYRPQGKRRDLAFSPEETLDRAERRAMIASAPRSTTVIDGREFTVLHLPDSPRIPYASFDTGRLGPLVKHPEGRRINPLPTTTAGTRGVVGGAVG